MLWLLISFGKVERLFVFTVISAGPWLEWSTPITRVMFFLIYPKHCKTDCDLSVPLTAIVYMIDYTEDYESPLEDDVPLFHSRKYQQEQIRWSKISLVAKSFKQRTKPREGISFTELAAPIGVLTMLDWGKGKKFI